MSEQSERAAYIAGLEAFRAELETCRAKCMAEMVRLVAELETCRAECEAKVVRLEAELEAKFVRKLETLQDELCAAHEEIARLRQLNSAEAASTRLQ